MIRFIRMNRLAPLLVVTFCALSSFVPAQAYQSPNTLRKLLKGEVCRGEEVCLDQVCDATSYQYDLGSAGKEFPYSVKYDVVSNARQTNFIFSVCSTTDGKKACDELNGGCSPLNTVKIRMRNDMLSMGRDLVTEPKGKMWASCTPHGPGHVWDQDDLGDLATSNPSNESCVSLTVVASGYSERKPTLKDICQQDLKIMENTGSTILDQKDYPASCIFVLEAKNGRVGYTALNRGGRKATVSNSKDEESESKDKKEETEEKKEESKDEKEESESKDKKEESEETVTSTAAPKPYGRSYGKRLMAMKRRADRRRLF
jgi:hypothetical protein